MRCLIGHGQDKCRGIGSAFAVVDRVLDVFRAHKVVGRRVFVRAVRVDRQRSASRRVDRCRSSDRRAVDFADGQHVAVRIGVVAKDFASGRSVRAGDDGVVVGVRCIVGIRIGVRLNVDRDDGRVGFAAWIADFVGERVFADEVWIWGVVERAIRVDHQSSVGGLGDRRCVDRQHVGVRIRVVAKQVGRQRVRIGWIAERFEAVVGCDRRRVGWIGCRVDDFQFQDAFDAVAVFVTDFQSDRVFANVVGRRVVQVRSVWVDEQRATVVGRQ